METTIVYWGYIGDSNGKENGNVAAALNLKPRVQLERQQQPH